MQYFKYPGSFVTSFHSTLWASISTYSSVTRLPYFKNCIMLSSFKDSNELFRNRYCSDIIALEKQKRKKYFMRNSYFGYFSKVRLSNNWIPKLLLLCFKLVFFTLHLYFLLKSKESNWSMEVSCPKPIYVVWLSQVEF